MSKSTHNRLFKSVHREMLKNEGNVHLPANKVEQPKTAYKRKKFNTRDIYNNED